MRKFGIDFHRPPPPSAGGWVLALAGVAALAPVGWQHMEQDGERHAQAARLARLQASNSAALAADRPDDPTLAAARQAMDRAQLPWASLFSALEAAAGKDVALLMVTPDPARRQVKIQAEARDLAAMLAFQRELQQQAGLAQVALMDHVVVKDVPEAPVRFHLQAKWGSARVLP
jgi:Tfp pilus assembly protein PilN